MLRGKKNLILLSQNKCKIKREIILRGKIVSPGLLARPCPLTGRIQNRRPIHRYFIFVLEDKRFTCSNKELIFSVSIIIFSLSGFPLANSCGYIMKVHDVRGSWTKNNFWASVIWKENTIWNIYEIHIVLYNMNFIYISHLFTAREDMKSTNWPRSRCVASQLSWSSIAPVSRRPLKPWYF